MLTAPSTPSADNGIRDSDIVAVVDRFDEDFTIESPDDVWAIYAEALLSGSPELRGRLSPLLVWRLQEPTEVLLTVDCPTGRRLASASTHFAEFRPPGQADVAATVRHALSWMLTILDGLLEDTPASKA